MAVQSLPIVTLCDGIPSTLSTDVAAFFQKRHDNVVRDIENIRKTLPSNRLLNFEETEVTRESPIQKGTLIKSKAYRLTRDGFTFLAMGFTGPKAQAFKWAYIDAFNRMENVLKNGPEQLTEQQAYVIMAEVATRAKTNGEHYQAIYRALKARYQVTKYSHILQRDFADAVQFIRTCDIAAPKQEPRALPKDGKPHLTPLNIPEGRKMYRVSEDFLEKQRTFIYCWRYLFRDDLELFYNFLKQTKSPLAPKFAEAIMDFNLYFVEDSLAKLGFAVKDLDCYKHWAAKQLTA